MIDWSIAGPYIIIVGLTITAFGVGIWHERKVNQKGWKDRALDAEKRYINHIANRDPQQNRKRNEFPHGINSIGEMLDYGAGIDPYEKEKEYKGRSEHPMMDNYIQPKWSQEQVHNWQGFLNKEFQHGTLNHFSCRNCNDQKYIFVKIQIGTDQIKHGDKTYDIPVYGLECEAVPCPDCVTRKWKDTECGMDCKRDCVDFCKNASDKNEEWLKEKREELIEAYRKKGLDFIANKLEKDEEKDREERI